MQPVVCPAELQWGLLVIQDRQNARQPLCSPLRAFDDLQGLGSELLIDVDELFGQGLLLLELAQERFRELLGYCHKPRFKLV